MMEETRPLGSKSRGRLRWLALLALILTLGIVVAACGGDDDSAEPEPAPPAEPEAAPEPEPEPEAAPEPTPEPEPEAAPAEPAAAECPFPDGVVRAFGTVDRAGTAGDIGPSMVRTFEPWIERLNAEGGIIGCQLEVTIPDEPFPDLDACLRNWQDGIAEGDKYAFYFGAFNSACMAAVPELTNAVGKVIIANSAADHQPFFEKFQRYNLHAAVSTFLEGRAMASFAAEQGWKRIATFAPNYAYGQDAERGFTEYFTQIVPDGEIVSQQFPESDESNFTPFISALSGLEYDALVTTFFGPFVVPLWKGWIAAGLEDIPNIGGITDMPGWEVVEGPEVIPANSYTYDRGYWEIMIQTPIGKEIFDLYTELWGDSEHPLPSAWTFPWISGIMMAKALAEQTGGFDPDEWIDLVETGTFAFESPYQEGLTKVNPINHMANTCAQVGPNVWDESRPVPAGYGDISEVRNYCMDDVLTAEEARQLTDNPNVTDEAVAAYYGG